jgi:hypothetical protein
LKILLQIAATKGISIGAQTSREAAAPIIASYISETNNSSAQSRSSTAQTPKAQQSQRPPSTPKLSAAQKRAKALKEAREKK